MLKRTLSEHAAECFYSDERLATLLWESLQPKSAGFPTDYWSNLQEHFYHLLVEGVEARYPREHRLTDVRQLMGHMCDGGLLLTPDLPWLQELQERLLLRNGDLLCYREREVQAYVRLAAGIDPTLLASWHLAQWLENTPKLTEHNIQRVVSAQTQFFAPLGNQSLPFAEGHVHFWGVTADNIILDKYFFGGNKLALSKKANLWEREQYDHLKIMMHRAHRLLALLLDQRQDWRKHLQHLLIPMDTPIALPDWQLLQDTLAAASAGSVEWLLSEFARAMQHADANRWLWLHLYLSYRYRAPDTPPLQRAAILCFWQTTNSLRRSLIMDGQGLTRFAERYYGAALGRGDDYQININRIWAGANDVSEIKSGPTSFNPKLAREIARGLITNAGLNLPKPPYIFGESEIPLDIKALTSIQALERWQYCGHFSRSVEHNQIKRPTPNSKKLWKDAEKLKHNLRSASGWSDEEFLGGNLNKNFRFQPSRWFRGLDVAGDENALKIEWFAPVLRWLRSDFSSSQGEELASTGFHLSIHAGEDYAHPASGMRHIDETVRFCEMREGDRLGHALALGVVPKIWAKRQGEMILPLDEHLDNLVWLWHYASLLSSSVTLAQQVLPLFTRRIARFWRESSWWQVPDLMNPSDLEMGSADFDNSPLRHTTPDDLFAAWLLRRNCHHCWKELFDRGTLDSKEIVALPDYEQLTGKQTLAVKLYLARHEWLKTNKDDQLVIVRTGNESQAQSHFKSKRKEKVLEDVETIAELDFMHALQDWLLSEYDNFGLIIEANPTSNVYIARLKSHAEHPIFRWSPPDESQLVNGAAANLYGLRRGPVRVLVNTDDPGIMPTTLRTEFLLLREAAFELNIGRTVAERWLEMLRQYGIEQFYRNHKPVFEPV